MTNLYIDNFDRTPGNGSRTRQEDWLDEHTTASKNQWSSAETTFYLSEAPPNKRNLFESLYDWHHYRASENRSAELAKMRMAADVDTFCAVLELPDSLSERVMHILQNIDVSANKFGGKSYEKISLAVITLVFDKFLSDRDPASDAFSQRLIFDDTFRSLMETNDLGSQELRAIREMVRQKTDYF